MSVTLYHGDCLEILPTLPDKSVDAIITDLPYGTTACKWDVIIPLDEMWKQVKRLCKGAFVTTASQPFTSNLIMSNPKWFRYEWIWDKYVPSGFQNCNKAPLKAHENIVVFSQNGHTYNPQKFLKQYANKAPRKDRLAPKKKTGSVFEINGMKYENRGRSEYSFPKSIILFHNGNGWVKRNNEHPTQKPVALYEYLIRTYTNEGDTVLDFCMGSGTTGCACVKTGRNFIGVERERNYFEIAERRIAEAQMQMVML